MTAPTNISINEISSILLLGIESEIALPVIRALGTVIPRPVPIHALSAENGTSSSKYSKYIHTHHNLESTGEDALLIELVNKIKKTGADILLPIDEHNVRLLSNIKDRLKKYIHLPPLPSPFTFDSLVYKDKLYELLKRNKLPNADYYSVSKLDTSRLDKLRYPIMLKPVRGSAGKGIIKVNNISSLLTSLKRLKTDEYVLQEYIPGENIDCSLLAVDGNIKALTIQRGLKSTGFNFSTEIKFEKNEAVLNIVKKLVDLTDYSGVAHLDFRLDERDNQPKLVDFNARFWFSLLGSKAAGVNFALLSCLAAKNIIFDKPKYKEIKYLMGKSTVNFYYRKILNRDFHFYSNGISTDLWDRISDPLPDIMNMLNYK